MRDVLTGDGPRPDTKPGPRRILVTGAAGFVGRHAMAALGACAGDQVVGIGRGEAEGLPEGVAYRRIDLLDAPALTAFVAEYRPTDVLHLAAMASVQQSADAPGETWRVNLVGLLNLAEAVTRSASASSARLFFVSSGEVYGRAFLAGHALTEDAVPEPQGAYAQSKRFGETILRDVLAKTNVRLVILRPFNQIGAGQDERFVVPSFAGQIARIEAGLVPPVLEVGNLAAARDFLPVGDVVRAYADLIARGAEIANGAVFNIASGRPRSIESVLADLRRHARADFAVRVAQDRMRPSEIPVAAGDASRLSAATGWAPRGDWDAALAAVLDHARATMDRTRQ